MFTVFSFLFFSFYILRLVVPFVRFVLFVRGRREEWQEEEPLERRRAEQANGLMMGAVVPTRAPKWKTIQSGAILAWS